MRLRTWLTRSLAVLRSAPSRLLSCARIVARTLAAFRLNPRACVFMLSCWLVFSGLRDWSPPAAKIAVGLILLTTLLRTEPAPPNPPAK